MQYLNQLTVEDDLVINHMILPSSPITATLNGTYNMDDTSTTRTHFVCNVTGFSVLLPNATTLLQGHKYEIMNTGSTPFAVKNGAGTLLFVLSQNSTAFCYLINNGTVAGDWNAWQIISDPNIASGIANYTMTSQTLFTTTSTTDVVITSFSVTPQAGTYAVWFSSRMQSSSGSAVNNWSVYKNNIQVADSERGARFGAAGSDFEAGTITRVVCNGTEPVDLRVRRSAGTLSVFDRTLLLIRLGA